MHDQPYQHQSRYILIKNKNINQGIINYMVSSIKRVLCTFYLSTSTTNHRINKSRLYIHCQSSNNDILYVHVSTTSNTNHSINNIQQQQSKLKVKYEENNPRTYNQYIDVATNWYAISVIKKIKKNIPLYHLNS